MFAVKKTVDFALNRKAKKRFRGIKIQVYEFEGI